MIRLDGPIINICTKNLNDNDKSVLSVRNIMSKITELVIISVSAKDYYQLIK